MKKMLNTNKLPISVQIFCLSLWIKMCYSACYFSPELQGKFVTQSTVTDNEVHYSQINITEDSIPIWGQCHKRIENNIILMIASEETNCFRCFHLKLVARNVLRVHTADKDYISKCFTDEDKAIASCPVNSLLTDETAYTEIILYKTHDFDGQVIHREYCPISGRYKLTYNVDDGQEDKIECTHTDSELDNCPSGSALNLRFRKCSFENHDITFECLGHWQGLGNKMYLALMNSRANDKMGPQYRCAVYDVNKSNGIVTILFNNDSTCTSTNSYKNSNSVTGNYHSETLVLYPVSQDTWPYKTFCTYPNWMIGHWEHMSIDNTTITYKDHSSFKTYTMKCIRNDQELEKFIVFARTQCKEEAYYCIWIKERSTNIFEFQIGSRIGSNASMIICDDMYFDENRWLTQGRLDENIIVSPCPVNGGFFGMIPDATELCAKLSSKCSAPDIMHYEVSACDYDQVYEEREYRCLGQWEEKQLVYTYTQRQDIGTYECFVGSMISDKRIFIKEAGKHCQRNIDLYRYGMELNKKVSCENTTQPSTVRTTTKIAVMTSSEKQQTTTREPILTTAMTVELSKITTSTTKPTIKSDSISLNRRNSWLTIVFAIASVIYFAKIACRI